MGGYRDSFIRRNITKRVNKDEACNLIMGHDVAFGCMEGEIANGRNWGSFSSLNFHSFWESLFGTD
jgi:hypothetical protein